MGSVKIGVFFFFQWCQFGFFRQVNFLCEFIYLFQKSIELIDYVRVGVGIEELFFFQSWGGRFSVFLGFRVVKCQYFQDDFRLLFRILVQNLKKFFLKDDYLENMFFLVLLIVVYVSEDSVGFLFKRERMGLFFQFDGGEVFFCEEVELLRLYGGAEQRRGNQGRSRETLCGCFTILVGDGRVGYVCYLFFKCKNDNVQYVKFGKQNSQKENLILVVRFFIGRFSKSIVQCIWRLGGGMVM